MKKNKTYKRALLMAACSLLTFCAVGCGTKKEKINPVDFIKAEYDGFNGHTNITLSIDKEKIGDKCKEVRDEKSLLDSVFLQELLSSMEIEYEDDSTEHKNGDKISVKFQWEEDLEEDCPYKIASDEEDFEISGLEEAEEIDPFEGIEVTFSGVAPKGEASINTDGCNSYAKDNGYYSVKEGNNYSLSNGDKIVIVYEYYEGTFISDKKIVTEDTKEYTVEGLSEYVTTAGAADFTEFNPLILQEVNQDLKEWDVYKYSDVKLIENTWPEYTFTAVPEFYRGYYAYNTQDTSTNGYIAVYKVNATATVTDTRNEKKIKKGQKFTKTFYYAVKTDKVTKDAAGKITIQQYEDWWTGTTKYGMDTLVILEESKILSDLQSDLGYSYDSITQLQ